MTRNEKRIRREAAKGGWDVVRYQYSRPVDVLMGDTLGGWMVTLQRGEVQRQFGDLTYAAVLASVTQFIESK